MFDSWTNKTLHALSDWDRHERVRIATLTYLNGGVWEPKGSSYPCFVVYHPLMVAVREWWQDERDRLNAILG
jgi:hypothetical protein